MVEVVMGGDWAAPLGLITAAHNLLQDTFPHPSSLNDNKDTIAELIFYQLFYK